MDTKQSRDALKALRDEIDTALAAVRDNNPGLKLDLGRCSFDYSGGFTFKLTGALPGGKSKEETAYEALRAALAIPEQTYVPGPPKPGNTYPTYAKGPLKPGIKLPDLQSTFAHNGVRYKVTGATRTKVITERLDGKVFTWKPEAVAKLSQRESAGVAS